MKIIDKLENVQSDYDSNALNHGWKENLKYRDILVKKGSAPWIQSQSQITISSPESMRELRGRESVGPGLPLLRLHDRTKTSSDQ